jgi:hypothetical protein
VDRPRDRGDGRVIGPGRVVEAGRGRPDRIEQAARGVRGIREEVALHLRRAKRRDPKPRELGPHGLRDRRVRTEMLEEPRDDIERGDVVRIGSACTRTRVILDRNDVRVLGHRTFLSCGPAGAGRRETCAGSHFPDLELRGRRNFFVPESSCGMRAAGSMPPVGGNAPFILRA